MGLDPRVRRTRKALSEALISLILEKGYNEITIKEITETADLRRATFYLHYKDKDELLMATLQETFDALVEHLKPALPGDGLAGKTQIQTIKQTFDHVAENRVLYRIILTEPGTAGIARRIHNYLAELVLNDMQTQPASRRPALPPPVIANYMAGVELTMIRWWLDEADTTVSTAEAAAMTHQLMMRGVQNIYEPVKKSN